MQTAIGSFRKTLSRGLLLLAIAGLGAFAAPAEFSSAQAKENAGQLPFDISQYRGKVVYLDFWASWCAPCKLSFHFMDRLRHTYGPNELAIVTVNLDHNRNAAAAFLSKQGVTLPVVYDSSGKLASRFKVDTMPTSVVFDRDGRVRYVHRGYFDDKSHEYMEQVRSLIIEHI